MPSLTVSKIVHGRYEKIDLLREDMYSYYYLGKSIYTHIQVLIREYKPDYLNGELIAKLVDRIRQSSLLIHPHILNVVDFCHSPESLCLVYEYMEARTLHEEIRLGHLSMVQTLECAAQMVSALRYALRKGLYHGHLTENQVLLTAKGQIKILNFGLESVLIEHMMQHHRLIEDAVFIAPEKLLDGRATPRAEVYALGILLYRMLTREFPYAPEYRLEGAKRNLLAVPKTPRDLNPHVPEYLSRVIMRAVDKEGLKRYKTVEDMFEDIQTRRTHVTAVAPARPPSETTQEAIETDVAAARKHKLRRVFGVLVAMALLGLILGGVRLMVLHYFTAIPVVTVPDLQGKSYSEATALLQRMGLRVEMDGFADDAMIPNGSVIRSRPAPGRDVRKGRLVALLVSRGADALSVPDLKSMLFDEAVQIAGARGLALVRTGEAYTRVYPPGTIMLQDPPPQTPIAGRSTLEVLVSKGYPIQVSRLDAQNVRIEFQVLPQWEREQIKVFVSAKDAYRKQLYDQWLDPGEHDAVSVTLAEGEVLEVFYGEQLAYSSQDMEFDTGY